MKTHALLLFKLSLLLCLLWSSSAFAQKIKSPRPALLTNKTCNTEKCRNTGEINFSTGIHPQTGNLLPTGTIDPMWQLVNLPPNSASGAAIPNAHVINAYQANWNAIPGTGILSPINANVGLRNHHPDQPWRFRTNFCLCNADRVKISGVMRADDLGSINVYDASGTLLYSQATVPSYSFATDTPFSVDLSLSGGSYYIEFHLVDNGIAGGFAVNGKIQSASSAKTLQRPSRNCCNNAGFLTVKKYLERGECNGRFGNGDQPGAGWTFVLYDADGDALQTQTTNANGEAYFNGLAPGTYTVQEQYQSGYVPSNGNGGVQYVTIKGDRGTQINFFNCPDKRDFCCPGKNLVDNPSFEYGNTGFDSEFIYTGDVSPGSVIPGKYNVITGTQAAAISNSWNWVQDPSTCDSDKGYFLATNGQTGGSPIVRNGEPVPAKKVVWEQDFKINNWATYKFCFKAKNLHQLGFPITTKIDVLFKNGGTSSDDLLDRVITSDPGKCDWKSINTGFNFNGAGTNDLKIQIVLHQTEHGDGNDLAIDDIALIQLESCPKSVAEFDVAITQNGNHYTVDADAELNDSCNKGAWAVCVVDPTTDQCEPNTEVYNPSAWYPVDTNFPGYDGSTNVLSGSAPGTFSPGKFYKIKHGVFGECKRWTEFSMFIYVAPNSNRVSQFTEQEFKVKKAEILRTLRQNQR